MRTWLAACAAVALVSSRLAFAAETPQPDRRALNSVKDKVSYSIGLSIGRNLKREAVDLDSDFIAQGIRDAVAGAKPLLTDEEIQEVMMAFQKDMRAKQAEQMKSAAEKNKKEGDAFLAENKKKEGVVTLPSGLQYKVIKEGTGAMPKLADTVDAHYRGTLLDGTEFDSSYKRGAPVSFPVDGVIPGWTEAIQKMKVGSKWLIYIPAELAYGARGAGREIGPNATLVFEVELVGINVKKEGEKEKEPPKEKER